MTGNTTKKVNPRHLHNCRVETDFQALPESQQCSPQPRTNSICKFEMPEPQQLGLMRRWPLGIPQSHQSR